MSDRRASFAVAASLALFGCRELPDIEPRRCGNGVLETTLGEDCDTYVKPGYACGLPGSQAACRYVWGVDDETKCPDGFGWGLDGVCRRPSGVWSRSPGVSLAGGGTSALVGDLDGDLLVDLVVGDSASGRYRAHFLAPGGSFRASLDLPASAFSGVAYAPALGSITGQPPPPEASRDPRTLALYDRTADVLLPTFEGLAVLRGRDGPSLSPKAYASYSLPPSRLLALPGHVADFETGGLDVEGILTEQGRDLVIVTVDGEGFNKTILSVPDASLVELENPLVRVEWSLDHPGEEVAFVLSQPSVPGEPPNQRLVVASLGKAASDSELLVDVRLSTLLPGRVDSPLFAVDVAPLESVTDDAAQELVFATRSGSVLDPVKKLAALTRDPSQGGIARAFEQPIASDEGRVVDVLFVGDFDADRRVEIVDGASVRAWVCSVPSDPNTCGPNQAIYVSRSIVPWTDAVITDLNRDGVPDLVAGSGLKGIDVVLGLVNTLRLPTSTRVSALRAGDFDGDGTTDVLYLSRSSGQRCDGEDELGIVWGEPLRAPGAPVVVASLRGVIDVVVGQLFQPPFIDTAWEFGAHTACPPEGEVGSLSYAAAVFSGSPARNILSSAIVGDSFTPGGDLALAAAVGRFVDDLGDERLDAALFGLRVTDDEVRPWVWTAGASGEGDLALSPPQVANRANLTDRDTAPIVWSSTESSLPLTAARAVAADLDPIGSSAPPRDEIALWLPTLSAFNNFTGRFEVTPALHLVELSERGEPSFRELVQASPVPSQPGELALPLASELLLGDLDGDGHLDAVGYLRFEQTRSIHVFWNVGGAGFVAQRIELQGDGVVSTSAEASLLEVTGVALLREDHGGQSTHLLVAGDFGVARVGLTGPDGSRAPPYIASWLVYASGSSYTGVATGDFDGDGRQDIAAIRPAGVDIYLQVDAPTSSVPGAPGVSSGSR